jgi:multiple sugar transport system substrate-binding protein
MNLRRAIVSAATATALCTVAWQGNSGGAVSLAASSHSPIVFSGWGDEEQTTKADFDWMMKSFSSQGKGNVSWVGWPYQDAEQQLVLHYKSSQQPDVAQLDMNWATTFSKLNALVDLNKVYGKAKLQKEFSPTLLKLGQRDGKQVALPWTIASIALVANKSLLQKAGITQLPKTTAQFQADLTKIKNREPGVIPYALNTKTPGLITAFFQPWLWTFGGTIFSHGKVAVNTVKSARAVGYLTNLINKGLVAKDVDIFDARTLFAQNKVAFYDDAIIARGVAVSTSKNQSFNKNVIAVPRPVVAIKDKPQSVQWGHVLVLFKKPGSTITSKSTAAQFAQYLLSPKVGLRYFKHQGLLPVTKAALKSPVLKQDAYFRVWTKITKSSRLDETAPYANGAQIGTVVGQNVQAAYLGQATPQQAVKQMAEQLAQIPIQ